LRLESDLGGQSRISDDDYVEGAPELIVEIASSSASYDLHDKLRVYRRNGVKEYIVWQVFERKLVWFKLEREEYVQLQPDEAGIIRSLVFPGLHLSATALLAGDLAQVVAEVQQGITTEAHQIFVESLTNKRSL
jgi:Uma2 family endonuclease